MLLICCCYGCRWFCFEEELVSSWNMLLRHWKAKRGKELCFLPSKTYRERKNYGKRTQEMERKGGEQNWYGQLGQAEKYGIIKMELMGPHRVLQVPFFSVVRCLRFNVHGDGWVDGWDVTWVKNIPCSCGFIGHKKTRSRISTHFFLFLLLCFTLRDYVYVCERIHQEWA